MGICLFGKNKCPLSALTGVRIKRAEFTENDRTSQETKKTVHNNKVSVLSGCL